MKRIVLICLFTLSLAFAIPQTGLAKESDYPPEPILVTNIYPPYAGAVNLKIPAIGIETIVIPTDVSDWRMLEENPIWIKEQPIQSGWHGGSPWFGQPGLTVIWGHSDRGTRVFEMLEKLKIGDEMKVENITYRVVSNEIVVDGTLIGRYPEWNKKYKDIGESAVLLVTCKIYGNLINRTVITLEEN